MSNFKPLQILLACTIAAAFYIATPQPMLAVQSAPAPIAANNNKPKPKPKYTEEEIQRVLKFLKKYRGHLATQLEQLKKQGKHEEYNKLVIRIASKVMHLVRRSESDPNGFKLLETEHKHSTDAAAIARRLRQAKTDKDRDSLRKQLKQRLDQAYEARIKIQEYELSKVEKRVKHLRDQIKKARQDKDKWIEGRLKSSEPRKPKPKPKKPDNKKPDPKK